MKRDLGLLLRDTDAAAITTMLDLYGLPDDFPGCGAGRTVDAIERAFASDIGDQRFLPYLSVHEFEALVFVEPSEIDTALPGADAAAAIRAVRDQYGSPEEINQGRDTHPSARLASLVRGYEKVLHGPLIVARAGLSRLRATCPHFDSWITRLERLA